MLSHDKLPAAGYLRPRGVLRQRLADGRPLREVVIRIDVNNLTLLLDSRVVDVPRAYNRTFVMLSSLKPFFFNSLQKELRFSNNAGA
jgi:hypothetical protein